MYVKVKKTYTIGRNISAFFRKLVVKIKSTIMLLIDLEGLAIARQHNVLSKFTDHTERTNSTKSTCVTMGPRCFEVYDI